MLGLFVLILKLVGFVLEVAQGLNILLVILEQLLVSLGLRLQLFVLVFQFQLQLVDDLHFPLDLLLEV